MIKMRRIKQEDNATVKRLICAIMEDEFVESAREYATDDLENTCERYSGKNEVFYVAEGPKGRIVGTVGVKNDTARTALLRRLFLKKEFRGKGYGSKLLRRALDFCKKHGYKKIIFRGTGAMAAAYKTCLKNGFCEQDILVLPGAKVFVLELEHLKKHPEYSGIERSGAGMKEILLALFLVLIANIIAVTVYIGCFHPEYIGYLQAEGVAGVLERLNFGRLAPIGQNGQTGPGTADMSSLSEQLKDIPFVGRILKDIQQARKEGSSIEELIAAAAKGRPSDYAPDKKRGSLMDSFSADNK